MTDEEIMAYLDKHFGWTGEIHIVNGEINCTGDMLLNVNAKISKFAVSFNKVTGDFFADRSALRSLVNGPKSVGGIYRIGFNYIESLKGSPIYVGKDFDCVENDLKSLVGLPRYVGGKFQLKYNTDLPLLPLLQILGCKKIDFYPNTSSQNHAALVTILNRYLHTGTQGMLPCADEMIDAGYGSNAHYD